MSEPLKINYLELPASDLDAIKAFYARAFGWGFVDYGPDYCAFTGAGIDGGFYRAPLASTTEAGGALVVLYAEALDGALDAVVHAGGTVCKEIFDFPGGRRFQFLDPNGNELAVWSDR